MNNMGKSLMADVAKLLDVELEEEFEIKNMGFIYKFTEDGLFYRMPMGEDWYTDLSDLTSLICGDLEIVKLPWKPKNGEAYYYAYFGKLSGLYVTNGTWCDNLWGNLLLKEHLIHRTREGAEAHLREDYKKLTGREWREKEKEPVDAEE